MADRNQIEKLSDVITKEITKINGTASETNNDKVTEKNNVVEKHFETFKDNSRKLKKNWRQFRKLTKLNKWRN